MKSFLKTLFATILGAIIAFGICTFLFFAIIGSIAALGSSDSVKVVPPSAILKIDFNQTITERETDDPFANFKSFSFEPAKSTISLLSSLQAIEKASTDPAIKFIYLNLNTLGIDIAQLEELRNALENFRESGKPIVAYANNYSQAAYYLASVADKVYVQKNGNGEFLGIGISSMFFKDLLDKLGIEVQLIRHGKFKAAAEQFVESNMSKANREQNQKMIDSIWDTWVSAISESRKISVEQLNALADDLKIGNAQSLVDNQFVDEAITGLELTDKLCDLFGVEKEKDLEIISLGDYAKAAVKPNIKAKDKIAVIYAEGEISMDGTEGITATEFCPMISKIKADSSIKAVVLRVNSPGGDAQAAEMINTELMALKEVKPIITSFGGYAASGGYWISAKSDYIFTDRTTLTGSIGVLSLIMNYGKGIKKHLDINIATVGTNKHSNMFGGMASLDKAEQQYMQNFVEDIYVNFIDLVAEGRKLDKEYTDSIAQGRVWSGSDALELKLADKIGGITDAIEYASAYVGLSDYRIVEYPTMKTSVEKFMEMFNESSVRSFILPESLKEIEKVYSALAEQEGVKTYARIPYIYELEY